MVNTVVENFGQVGADALKPWELQGIVRAHMLHCQLQAAMQHAKTSKLEALHDMDFMAADSPYMLKLARLYRENMALANMLDSSDLLLHAEGPGATRHSPRLSAVNWLCSGAEKHILKLLAAMLPMAQKNNHTATKNLDLRLTGIAPGSLYAGFSLVGTHIGATPMLLDDEQTILQWLRQAIHALPVVPQYVGVEKMDKTIMQALPDPALRDAAMVAAYELAPTGSKGIHTVEISAPLACESSSRNPQPLGQKERVVLREAIHSNPMMLKSRRGAFVGVLRGIDLDSARITVRNISPDITALRGAVTNGLAEARHYLDQPVRIEGEYESTPDGRPRMMRVEKIELANHSIDGC